MSGVLSERKILLIPSTVRGNGTGHLRRCLSLAAGLAKTGNTVSVLAESDAGGDGAIFSPDEIAFLADGKGSGRGFSFVSASASGNYDTCIFDMRETPEKLFYKYSGLSFCIGIDEGGEMRAFFDYLIDVLPNLETHPANVSSIGFLRLPTQGRSERKFPPERILVSFGGEDRAGLTEKLVNMLVSEGFFNPEAVTVVRGPMFGGLALPGGTEILDSPEDLGSKLGDYDLVFTMFGITCFESLYSGTPVVLFNPSEYHGMLARKAGIPEIGVSEPLPQKLRALLSSSDKMYDAVGRYSSAEVRDLAGFVDNLHPTEFSCRFCGSRRGKMIHRAEERVFLECSGCGLFSMYDFREQKTEYGTEYFFEDYKKQYGRTYLEDFDNIKRSGIRRCGIIGKIRHGGSLLDIGCGYGPFLSAASDSGFEVFGIDISENAAVWTKENLGFPVAAADALSFNPEIFGRKQFSAVTMWYVIEHMEHLPEVLHRISMMIEPGGVFAFATPNYSGVSGRRSLHRFLEASPDDHYTVWSPGSARAIMDSCGFRIYKVCCPVIHPSRFFKKDVYQRLPSLVRGLLDIIIRAAGRLLKLGDTFEVYCVKTSEAAPGEI